METTIVNGRVSSDTMSQASRVLEAFGITASSAIRNLMEFIARTGTVPECVIKEPQVSKGASVRAATQFFESQPMPGRTEGVTDEQIIWEERMARHG